MVEENLKIKLTKSQALWLMKVTGTSSPQEGIDYFARLMREEGIDPTEIVTYIRIMIQKGVDI